MPSAAFARLWLAPACLLALAACGGGEPVSPVAQAVPEAVQVSPADFALIDCGVKDAQARCVIVSAGGKRLLVGAPAGIGAALGPDGLLALDAVLLPSLAAGDLEGLDEVRNQGWMAGRRRPIPVAGPKGVIDVARAINGAYQTADAIAQVRDNPPGGFGAALLAPDDGEGAGRWTTFTTGDLVVEAIPSGAFAANYLVTYEGRSLLVRSCLAGASTPMQGTDATLTCAPDPADATQIAWPLARDIVFIEPKK